jgi:hypothetical protein
MNNHYIPQLLLRQFAENGKVNSYNVETGEFSTKRIKKAFCEENLFNDELEERFAKEIEGPFGNLLNHKLLAGKDSIQITRQENLLIRKFHLIQLLRSPYSSMTFDEIMTKAKELDDPGVQFVRTFVNPNEIFGGPSSYAENLELVMKYDTIEDLLKQEDLPYTVKFSALNALTSYYAIWDTTDIEEEFLLAKLQGLSLRDYGGICYKLQMLMDYREKKDFKGFEKENWNRLIGGIMGNSDNYWICPLSPTRALVGISTYFRAFFPALDAVTGKAALSEMFDENQFKRHFFEPMRMELFEPCTSFYNKEYRYSVKQLTPHELHLQNALTLNEEMEEFVFHDYARIRDSFWAYENIIKMGKKKHDYSGMI